MTDNIVPLPLAIRPDSRNPDSRNSVTCAAGTQNPPAGLRGKRKKGNLPAPPQAASPYAASQCAASQCNRRHRYCHRLTVTSAIAVSSLSSQTSREIARFSADIARLAPAEHAGRARLDRAKTAPPEPSGKNVCQTRKIAPGWVAAGRSAIYVDRCDAVGRCDPICRSPGGRNSWPPNLLRAMPLTICGPSWRRRWLAGERVSVETFLSQHPELAAREQDVVAMIAAEVALRQSQGERPDRAEYVGRFPAYAARIEKLFEPKATLGSLGGGSTRKDAPAGILETAGFDQPTVDNGSAALATQSFAIASRRNRRRSSARHRFVRPAPYAQPIRHRARPRGPRRLMRSPAP